MFLSLLFVFCTTNKKDPFQLKAKDFQTTIGGKKTIIAVFNLPNGVSEKLNLSVTKSNKAKLTPKKDVMMAKLAKLFSNFSSCSLGTTWLIAATKTPMLPPSAIMGRNACR